MRIAETPSANRGPQDNHSEVLFCNQLTVEGEELPPIKHPELTAEEEARLEGYWLGVDISQQFIDQARVEADRYYRIAARGGFGESMLKPQGRTFAQLEALRRGASS